MRIAYLVHFYPPTSCGGAGYYTAMLAESFREHGHEVGVLCVDKWGEGSTNPKTTGELAESTQAIRLALRQPSLR
jgi:prephenate dehydrogenase